MSETLQFALAFLVVCAGIAILVLAFMIVAINVIDIFEGDTKP